MEDSRWQTELSSLKERNMHAFNNSLFCDVEFSVMDSNGNKVTLQAHKYVLAISSPVFEAMFYGELAETGLTIDLPDCTKEGLQELLRYVYSDEVNLTGRNVMDVLYAAQKYMMPFLEKKCNEYLQKDLEPEDVFFVLPQAQQTKNDKAELCCWNVIDFETQRAVTSEPFLNISHELLCQVLGRETLHVEEVNLFKAVDKWASNQIQEKEQKDDGSAKRTALGEDVIRLIRFPVMSWKEVAKLVLPKKILQGDEVTEIVQILSDLEPSETKFNTKKREGQWNDKWTANRFIFFDNSVYKYNRSIRSFQQHSIQFQVSQPIFLAGVRLFGDKAQGISVGLSISKSCVERASVGYGLHLNQSSELICSTFIDKYYYGFTVMLDEPWPLQPNEWYTIKAMLSSRNNDCPLFGGSEGQDAVKCDDITITFKNSEVISESTVERGQFPSFLLKRKINLKQTK